MSVCNSVGDYNLGQHAMLGIAHLKSISQTVWCYILSDGCKWLVQFAGTNNTSIMFSPRTCKIALVHWTLNLSNINNVDWLHILGSFSSALFWVIYGNNTAWIYWRVVVSLDQRLYVCVTFQLSGKVTLGRYFCLSFVNEILPIMLLNNTQKSYPLCSILCS